MPTCDQEIAIIDERESAKALQCAIEQATTDLPTIEVREANISSRANGLPHAPVRLQVPHWYVTVTIQRLGGATTAQVFYHVWRTEETWKAAHVGWVLPKKARRGSKGPRRSCIG